MVMLARFLWWAVRGDVHCTDYHNEVSLETTSPQTPPNTMVSPGYSGTPTPGVRSSGEGRQRVVRNTKVSYATTFSFRVMVSSLLPRPRQRLLDGDLDVVSRCARQQRARRCEELNMSISNYPRFLHREVQPLSPRRLRVSVEMCSLRLADDRVRR